MKTVKKEKVLKSWKGERSKEQVQDNHKVARNFKSLHSEFEKAKEELMGHRTWDWLKKGSLKKETESLIIAAQDQAISTNITRKNIKKIIQGSYFIHVLIVWKIQRNHCSYFK